MTRIAGFLSSVYWRPLWAPETETGTGAGDGAGGGAPPGTVTGDDEGAGLGEPERRAPDQRSGKNERRSVRQELEAGFDDARKEDKPRGRSGRFAPGGARGAEGEQPAEQKEVQAEAGAPGEEQAGEVADTGAPQAAAPAGWAKEAKAEWAKLPAPVQAAVLKREADVQRGVDELKGKYADIDGAIQPHVEAIRRHGHTPAQAVSQLFGWFKALAENPHQAFPALARSFGFDLAGAYQQQPAAGQVREDQRQPDAAAQTEDAIPPAVQRYVDSVLQKLGPVFDQYGQKLTEVERNFAAQSEAKTHEVLNTWAKDKPYFERVRATMAQLIASGAVPLVEGRVDLDGAYSKALWFHDDIRGEVLSRQEADRAAAARAKTEAATAAQARKVEEAKRASGSLAPAAPGTAPASAARRGKKGLSVRESIMAAKEELTA